MKHLLLILLVGLAPGLTYASATAGEKKAQICLLCHKPNNPMAIVPTLDGQTREYLYAQIKAYREKRRHDPVMQANVATLSEKDMRDLAGYFASLKPVRASFQLDPQRIAKGESKVKELKCSACHMPDFSGEKEAPRLAGLDPRYLGPQIVAFTLSQRPHPYGASMGAISEEDAENLAQYFAQLP